MPVHAGIHTHDRGARELRANADLLEQPCASHSRDGLNAHRPAPTSNGALQPSLQLAQLAGSAGAAPPTASGGITGGVPTIVSDGPNPARAPKSSSLQCPSPVLRTLRGLRSRWIRRRAWRSERDVATSRRYVQASR